MGLPNPVVSRSLLAEFKAALRELRRRAGDPTYRTMSRRSGVSVATLHGVDSGNLVPTLGATIAYVFACDGDRQLWGEQHRQMLRASRVSSAGRATSFMPWRSYFDGEKAPPPPSAAALRAEMRRIRVASGLTLLEIAERTRRPDIAEIVGDWGLGVTTISDLCNARVIRVPRRRTLHGFLLAVDAEPRTIERWLTVRNQLEAKRDPQLQMDTHHSGSKPVAAAVLNREGNAGQAHGDVVETRNVLLPEGEFQLARFRRLRNDLAGGGNFSPERIRSVLEGIGVERGLAIQLANDQSYATAFVLRADREVHKIMTENRLLSTPLALELGVRRVSSSLRYSPEKERRSLGAELNEAEHREHRIQAQRLRAEAEAEDLEFRTAHARATLVRARNDLDESQAREREIAALARKIRSTATATTDAARTAEAWNYADEAHAVWVRVAASRAAIAEEEVHSLAMQVGRAHERLLRFREAENQAIAELHDIQARVATLPVRTESLYR